MSDDATEPSALARQLFATLSGATDNRPAVEPAADQAAELRAFAHRLFAPTKAENDPTEGEPA